jgi:hypothetical protein
MDARRWWWRLSSIVVVLFGTATDAAVANSQDWRPWGMHMMWGSWGAGMTNLAMTSVLLVRS